MTWKRLAIHALFRAVVALGRSKARWDRFWWRVTPWPRRCAHRGCGRDWFDTWFGAPYCRVHHPEYEVPIGGEVVRRVPWVDDDRGQCSCVNDPRPILILLAAIIAIRVVVGL